MVASTLNSYMKNTEKNGMRIIINQKYAVTFGFPNSKKNSFRGNYMRKYGIYKTGIKIPITFIFPWWKTALPRATWYKLNFAHFLAPKTYQGTNTINGRIYAAKTFRDMVRYLWFSCNKDSRECSKKPDSVFVHTVASLNHGEPSILPKRISKRGKIFRFLNQCFAQLRC